MAQTIKFMSHDQYIEHAPRQVQTVLNAIQELVECTIPGAERCISYNIPAFRKGKVFFYFAAFKHHIGIYPPVKNDAALLRELARFRNEKGNLRFPLNAAIPYDLIEKVVRALAKEHSVES